MNFHKSELETTVKPSDKFTDMFISKLAGLQVPLLCCFQGSDVFEWIQIWPTNGYSHSAMRFCKNYFFVLEGETCGFHWNMAQATLLLFAINFWESPVGKMLHIILIIYTYPRHETTVIHNTFACLNKMYFSGESAP